VGGGVNHTVHLVSISEKKYKKGCGAKYNSQFVTMLRINIHCLYLIYAQPLKVRHHIY
jgi:hypothetical protein